MRGAAGSRCVAAARDGGAEPRLRSAAMAEPEPRSAQSPLVSSSSSFSSSEPGHAQPQRGAFSCAAAAGGRGGAFVPTPPPSSNGIPAPKESDSPESPFEVVPDRAAFDREYGPGSIPMAEREVLSQIPEDRVCDFPVKARTGNGIPGLPAKLPTGLSRQASGTAAALEEVSKCVREMHSFTSELLSWDLVERNGGNGNSAGNPGPAEADSSGDSDDTVIEEAPMEETPFPIPPGANPIPNPIPAARDWEEERLTLRALQELGEPPREPPDPSGSAAEPPPPAGRPLLLQPSLAARELLLWRDPRRSALVLGASLAPLLSLAALSAVSVCAHVALALLCVTVSTRAARGLLQALHRAEEGHPFRAYLERDITVSPETFHAAVAAAAPHLNRALRLLLRLFLVEDLVDSLKLAVCMWLLTYVGAVFNGITLLILAELLAFSLPPLYEKYKVQIDQYVAIARSHSKDLMAKIQAKVPGLAKKKPE
ncbi:uncharacterized protein ACIB01_019162 isoform 2-T2 [Guaruba guarouba]